VYSGKALFAFCAHARDHPEQFRGKAVLFWHTGGALGAYDKADQILPLLPQRAARLAVAKE